MGNFLGWREVGCIKVAQVSYKAKQLYGPSNILGILWVQKRVYALVRPIISRQSFQPLGDEGLIGDNPIDENTRDRRDQRAKPSYKYNSVANEDKIYLHTFE
ncbi:hypothetical protein B0H13DRAFT_1861624 [Mycena leptocephala]|nr:hypothetical protein B0H13DRAFT_1861624 [Mycena leptocephala]